MSIDVTMAAQSTLYHLKFEDTGDSEDMSMYMLSDSDGENWKLFLRTAEDMKVAFNSDDAYQTTLKLKLSERRSLCSIGDDPFPLTDE